MTIDTRTSEPVSQKPYPIVMKHFKWVQDKINKLIAAKVIWWSWSSWSASIVVVPKGDGVKWLVIDYHALNKITWKFILPMSKVEDILHSLMEWNTSHPWISEQVTTISHWMSHQYPKQHSPHCLGSMNTSKYLLDSCKHWHTSKN